MCAVLRNAARLCCWAVSYGVSACRKSGNFIIITVYGISVGVAHRLGCCAYNSRASFSVIVCGRTVTKMNGCRFAVWVTDKSVLESLKIRNTRCILRCRVTEVQSDFLKLFFVFVPCIGGVPWLLVALWQYSIIWVSERRLVNLFNSKEYMSITITGAAMSCTFALVKSSDCNIFIWIGNITIDCGVKNISYIVVSACCHLAEIFFGDVTSGFIIAESWVFFGLSVTVSIVTVKTDLKVRYILVISVSADIDTKQSSTAVTGCVFIIFPEAAAAWAFGK